jgi:hypothetical protein
MARASSRLATFAQMMQSSRATPIISVSRGVSNVARTLENPLSPGSMYTRGLRDRNSSATRPGAFATIVRVMNGVRS